MRALGEIRNERAVQALTEQLTYYGKGEGAWSALDALARIAHPSSVPVFKTRLTDKDAYIRRAAIEGLARAGDVKDVEPLMLGANQDESAMVRAAVAFALYKKGQVNYLNRLIDFARDDRLSPQLQGYFVELGPAVIADVVVRLQEPDPDTRRNLVVILGALGDQSTVPVLTPYKDDPNQRSRHGGDVRDRAHQDVGALTYSPIVIVPRAFYARPTLEVARDLIGRVLVHDARGGTAAGVIVEVEAYIGESDPACHAAPGPTKRNAPLYGPPGIAYVYLNYGMHNLVNAVTEPEGFPAAVLIRALEPIAGEDLMRRRRARGTKRRRDVFTTAELCRGPGNLTRALGITLRENRRDLCDGPLRIEDWGLPPRDVAWSRRIGINVGVETEWRVSAVGSDAVSGPRAPAGRA